MPRPKFATGHDDNHFIVRDALRYYCSGYTVTNIGTHPAYQAWLRGVKITAIDTSRVGGLILDWIIYANGQVVFVEVKTPEALKTDAFKPGERWTLMEFGDSAIVVSTDQDVCQMLDRLVEKGEGRK